MKNLKFLRVFLLKSMLFPLFFSVSLSSPSSYLHENSHIFPRPLILEYPDEAILDNINNNDDNEMLRLKCTSWRFALEANNLSPWKRIPEECGDYVKDYVIGKAYKMDLERVSYEASMFAKSIVLNGDGKDVWVFDVDETLISNLPYYAQHGYGLEVFDSDEFDKWVGKGRAPAIEPSFRLYEELLGLGFKIFLLTGRGENQREVTIQNLINVGYKNWDKLILRATEDHGKMAAIYKSEKRTEMENDGYRIMGNSGDQWSDLLGASMSVRSFKLPNPMYYIP